MAPGIHLASSPEHIRQLGCSKLRFLQAQNQAAIDQLRAGTDANRAKFLDQRLHKQQKLAASAKYSRQWYANEKDWLAGTTADAQAAPAFFDELEHVSLWYTDDVQPYTVDQPVPRLSSDHLRHSQHFIKLIASAPDRDPQSLNACKESNILSSDISL